jgi:hypothetical protein
VALSTINQTKPKITPVKNYLDFGRYIFISEMSRMVGDGRRSFYNGRHVLWLYQLLSNHRVYITYTCEDCNKLCFFRQCLYITGKNIYMRVTQSFYLIYHPLFDMPIFRWDDYGIRLMSLHLVQGRIHDFKLGRAHLKKLRRAEGGAKIFWVFRVKNHDFTSKKSYFFQF